MDRRTDGGRMDVTHSFVVPLLQALSHLTKHSVAIFQNVLEKVGLGRVLAAMAMPVSRVQQAVVTMFAAVVTADGRQARLLLDKVRDS